MTVGDRIRQERERIGMTQEALGKLCDVKKQTIYKYEANIITNIPTDKLEIIASALHVSPGYLMGWEDVAASVPAGFEPLPTLIKIPLVGSIACGEPITAEENIEDYVDAPAESHPDFALRCKGESMIEAGIEDGDIVYIRKVPEVRNGEIAAVRIGDEATLKYVYWNHSALTLVPANKSMAPRTYTGEALEDVHIEGKAVGFTHWFK